MKLVPHPVRWLTAAVLLSTPAMAELTVRQKAAVAVITFEIQQQALIYLTHAAGFDPAAQMKLSVDIKKNVLPKGWLAHCWPYDLGVESRKAGDPIPEPPLGLFNFPESNKVTDLMPTVADPARQTEVARTPTQFFVQFSRYVGGLVGVDGRGAPYAQATALPDRECDGVAAELSKVFKGSAGSDPATWKRAVPLARDGLVSYVDRADKLLEAHLKAFLKKAPTIKAAPGGAHLTKDEQATLGLSALQIELGKGSGGALFRILLMKESLDDLRKKVDATR